MLVCCCLSIVSLGACHDLLLLLQLAFQRGDRVVQSLLFDSTKGYAARANGPGGSFSQLPEAGSNVRLHQLHPTSLLLTPQVTLPCSYDRLPVWGRHLQQD